MTIAMADAIHYMPDRPTLLVQVHTDEGIVGVGEAAAYSGFLESTEALITGELRPAIVGQDPFRVEKLWQMMATRAHQRGRSWPSFSKFSSPVNPVAAVPEDKGHLHLS